MYYNTNYY
jgi:calcyphosin